MQPPPKIMVERYVNITDAEKGTAERSSITFDLAKEQNLDTVLFLRPFLFQPFTNKAFGSKMSDGCIIRMLPKWQNSGTFIGPTNHMCHDERSKIPSAAPDGGMTRIWTPSRVFHSKKLHSNEKVPGSPGDRIPPHGLTKDQRVGE
ncbi:hypothetical protein FDECE_18253 [Fusarium decemcellulare]|nr:hypothetical protein FDECE_18253 [Fusarium decemcellulare]